MTHTHRPCDTAPRATRGAWDTPDVGRFTYTVHCSSGVSVYVLRTDWHGPASCARKYIRHPCRVKLGAQYPCSSGMPHRVPMGCDLGDQVPSSSKPSALTRTLSSGAHKLPLAKGTPPWARRTGETPGSRSFTDKLQDLEALLTNSRI